ncbi:hypothetical protein DMENIID0001_084410 [Sergentomyia squamirostris]
MATGQESQVDLNSVFVKEEEYTEEEQYENSESEEYEEQNSTTDQASSSMEPEEHYYEIEMNDYDKSDTEIEPEAESVNECPYCGTWFSSIEEINQHIKIHVQEEEEQNVKKDEPSKVFHCPYCKESSPEILDIFNHMFHHIATIETTCRICNSFYHLGNDYKTSENRIVNHWLTHVKNPILDQNGLPKKYTCNSHLTRSKSKLLKYKYKCKTCNIIYRTPKLLENHMKYHNSQALRKCTPVEERTPVLCFVGEWIPVSGSEKTMLEKANVASSPESQKEEFLCTICNRDMETEFLLKSHMMSHKYSKMRRKKLKKNDEINK